MQKHWRELYLKCITFFSFIFSPLVCLSNCLHVPQTGTWLLMVRRLRLNVTRRDLSCPSSCSTSPQPTSPSSVLGRWPPLWCHPLTLPYCLQPPSSPPTSIGTSWGHRWGGGGGDLGEVESSSTIRDRKFYSSIQATLDFHMKDWM